MIFGSSNSIRLDEIRKNRMTVMLFYGFILKCVCYNKRFFSHLSTSQFPYAFLIVSNRIEGSDELYRVPLFSHFAETALEAANGDPLDAAILCRQSYSNVRIANSTPALTSKNEISC